MKRLVMTFVALTIFSGMTQSQGPDVPNAVKFDSEGNVYVAGTSMNSAGIMEYVLLSYDGTGQLVETYRLPGEAAGPSIVSSLAISEDRVIMTGSSPTATTGYDIVTVSRKRIPSSVDDPAVRPGKMTLEQSYPNPLHAGGTAIITYTLPESGTMELSVTDIAGRVVAVLEEGFRHAGSYRSSFRPGELSSGTYFYVLRTSTSSEIEKLAVIR